MKVLLLSPLECSHTHKWAVSLAQRDVKVCVIGLGTAYDPQLYEHQSNLEARSLGIRAGKVTKTVGNITKLSYLMTLPSVNRAIHSFKPDLVHAHFASSNGLLGALANFHPFIVSVWGSDIFDFPEVSPVHRAIMRFNLSKADRLLSTSMVMARQTSKFTDKHIDVTPFGVDTRQFSPAANPPHHGLVIGTIKHLEPKYGVNYLLQAFKIVADRHPLLTLGLLVVGGGSQRKQLEALAVRLGIQQKVRFMGAVPHREVARCHNMIDIAVFTSTSDSESFGVAAVEASACGKPVVASEVGGLPEVVEHGVTGFLVPPRDPVKTADAIERLILDRSLRDRMGLAGRLRVEKLFRWDDCVDQMISIYRDTLNRKAGVPM